MQTPLFVPFKIRNQIINENNTKQKDISEFSANKQYQILLSYMPEKNIYNGVQKRINDKLYNKKARNSFSTPYEAFKNGWSDDQIKEWIRTHPIKGAGNRGNAFISFAVASIDDTGLKAYWKFNETSGDIINQSQSAVDLGVAADIQITGATYSVAGIIGNAISFDGVDDFGVIGTSLSQFNYMHNTTALWTCAFWLKYGSIANGEVLIDNHDLTGTNIGLNVRAADTDKIRCEIANGTAEVLSFTSSVGYLPDTTNWHFYVLTYDQSLGSNNFKIIRDDANLEQATKTAETPSSSNATSAMNVARRTSNSLFGDFDIDETSWWNKIVSSTDKTSLYNSGNGKQIY